MEHEVDKDKQMPIDTSGLPRSRSPLDRDHLKGDFVDSPKPSAFTAPSLGTAEHPHQQRAQSASPLSTRKGSVQPQTGSVLTESGDFAAADHHFVEATIPAVPIAVIPEAPASFHSAASADSSDAGAATPDAVAASSQFALPLPDPPVAVSEGDESCHTVPDPGFVDNRVPAADSVAYGAHGGHLPEPSIEVNVLPMGHDARGDVRAEAAIGENNQEAGLPPTGGDARVVRADESGTSRQNDTASSTGAAPEPVDAHGLDEARVAQHSTLDDSASAAPSSRAHDSTATAEATSTARRAEPSTPAPESRVGVLAPQTPALPLSSGFKLITSAGDCEPHVVSSAPAYGIDAAAAPTSTSAVVGSEDRHHRQNHDGENASATAPATATASNAATRDDEGGATHSDGAKHSSGQHTNGHVAVTTGHSHEAADRDHTGGVSMWAGGVDKPAPVHTVDGSKHGGLASPVNTADGSKHGGLVSPVHAESAKHGLHRASPVLTPSRIHVGNFGAKLLHESPSIAVQQQQQQHETSQQELAPPSTTTTTTTTTTRTALAVDLDKATEALAHRIATLPPSQKKQLQRIAQNPLNSPLSTSSSTTSSSPMSKGRKATALGEPLVQPVHAVAAAVSGGGGGTTDAGGASKTNTMGTTTLSRSSALLRAANTSLTPGGDWSTKSTPTNAKVSAAVPACPDNALVLALNALQQQHDASSGSRQADVAVIAGTKCISAPPAAMTGTTTSAKLFDPFDARDYLTGRTSVAWSVVSALQHAAGGETGKSAPTAAMPATTLAGGAASSVTDSLVLQRSNASLMLVDSRSSGGGGGGSSFNVIGGSNGGGGGGGGTRVPRTQSSGSGGASYNLTSMGSSGSGSRIPIRSKYMSGGAGAPVRPPILRDLSLSGASLTGGQGGGFGVSEHALLNSTEELSEASVALGIPAKQQQHTSSSSSSSGKKQWMKAGDFNSPLAVPLRVQHGRHAGRGGKALSTLTSSKALKPAPHNDISSGGDLVSTTTSSQMGVGLGYASILYAGTNTMGGESVSCVSPSRGRNLKKKTIEEMEQGWDPYFVHANTLLPQLEKSTHPPLQQLHTGPLDGPQMLLGAAATSSTLGSTRHAIRSGSTEPLGKRGTAAVSSPRGRRASSEDVAGSAAAATALGAAAGDGRAAVNGASPSPAHVQLVNAAVGGAPPAGSFHAMVAPPTTPSMLAGGFDLSKYLASVNPQLATVLTDILKNRSSLPPPGASMASSPPPATISPASAAAALQFTSAALSSSSSSSSTSAAVDLMATTHTALDGVTASPFVSSTGVPVSTPGVDSNGRVSKLSSPITDSVGNSSSRGEGAVSPFAADGGLIPLPSARSAAAKLLRADSEHESIASKAEFSPTMSAVGSGRVHGGRLHPAHPSSSSSSSVNTRDGTCTPTLALFGGSSTAVANGDDSGSSGGGGGGSASSASSLDDAADVTTSAHPTGSSNATAAASTVAKKAARKGSRESRGGSARGLPYGALGLTNGVAVPPLTGISKGSKNDGVRVPALAVPPYTRRRSIAAAAAATAAATAAAATSKSTTASATKGAAPAAVLSGFGGVTTASLALRLPAALKNSPYLRPPFQHPAEARLLSPALAAAATAMGAGATLPSSSSPSVSSSGPTPAGTSIAVSSGDTKKVIYGSSSDMASTPAAASGDSTAQQLLLLPSPSAAPLALTTAATLAAAYAASLAAATAAAAAAATAAASPTSLSGIGMQRRLVDGGAIKEGGGQFFPDPMTRTANHDHDQQHAGTAAMFSIPTPCYTASVSSGGGAAFEHIAGSPSTLVLVPESPNVLAASEARRRLLARIYLISSSRSGEKTDSCNGGGSVGGGSGSDGTSRSGGGGVGSSIDSELATHSSSLDLDGGSSGGSSGSGGIITTVTNGSAPDSFIEGEHVRLRAFGAAGPYRPEGGETGALHADLSSGSLSPEEAAKGAEKAAHSVSSSSRDSDSLHVPSSLSQQEAHSGSPISSSPSGATSLSLALGAASASSSTADDAHHHHGFVVPSISAAAAAAAAGGGGLGAQSIRSDGTLNTLRTDGTEGAPNAEADAAAVTYVRSAAAAAVAPDADAYVDAIVMAEAAAEVVFNAVAQGSHVNVLDESAVAGMAETHGAHTAATALLEAHSTSTPTAPAAADATASPARQRDSLRAMHDSPNQRHVPSAELSDEEIFKIRDAAHHRAALKVGISLLSPPSSPLLETPTSGKNGAPAVLDNNDLLQRHYDALHEFAREHAPAMAKSLPTAWEKYGKTPAKLWAVITERYPDTAPPYYAPIDVESRRREGLVVRINAAGERAVARARAARVKMLQATERAIARSGAVSPGGGGGSTRRGSNTSVDSLLTALTTESGATAGAVSPRSETVGTGSAPDAEAGGEMADDLHESSSGEVAESAKAKAVGGATATAPDRRPSTVVASPQAAATKALNGAASSPKLSAPVPENDDDLAPWHYERLIRFAHEVAPSMLSTIPEAWQRFGKAPLRIWTAVDKRFPVACVPYVAELIDIAEERAHRRAGGAPTPGKRVFPRMGGCNKGKKNRAEEEDDVPPRVMRDFAIDAKAAVADIVAAAAEIAVSRAAVSTGDDEDEQQQQQRKQEQQSSIPSEELLEGTVAEEGGAAPIDPVVELQVQSQQQLSFSIDEPVVLSPAIIAALAPFAPPPNDDDLASMYRERLMLYASEVAPEIEQHIESAFERFADRPLLLFASCERKYPNTTNEYVEDLVATTEMRKIAREEWHKAAELGAPVVPCALVDLLRRSDPDLSTIPDDDGDILQVHFARMAAFAEAHAPSMLASLNAAFARHAARPETLWRAIARRFPASACEPFFLDVIALQEARMEGRARLSALIAAAGLSENTMLEWRIRSALLSSSPSGATPAHSVAQSSDGVSVTPPASSSSSTHAYMAEPAVGGGDAAAEHQQQHQQSSVTHEAAVAAEAVNGHVAVSPGHTAEAHAEKHTSAAAAAAAAVASSSQSPPPSLRLGVSSRRASQSYDTTLELKEGALKKLVSTPGVHVSVESTYVEPPGLYISRTGQVLSVPHTAADSSGSHAPEGEAEEVDVPPGATLVCLTRDVAPLPDLLEATRQLQALTVDQMDALTLVKETHPALLVSHGVLCVLLGVSPNWRSALSAIVDPLLLEKLVYLSTLDVSMPTGAVDGQQQHGEQQHDDFEHRGDGSDTSGTFEERPTTAGVTFAGTALHSASSARQTEGATAVLSARNTFDLEQLKKKYAHVQLSARTVTVCRRLLNRRPDIRAEVRCMRLAIKSSDGGGVKHAPLIALQKLVDWEVALVLKASAEQKAAMLAASERKQKQAAEQHAAKALAQQQQLVSPKQQQQEVGDGGAVQQQQQQQEVASYPVDEAPALPQTDQHQSHVSLVW